MSLSAINHPSVTTAPWGSGQPIPGTPFRQLVTGAATEGRMVVLEVDMPVGERVAEHTHEGEDQICVVVSGKVGGTVGDREVLLTDGSVYFFPRGVPHTLWNAGDEVARLLDIYTPAGFEKVFELAGAGAGAAGRPQS
ncbi:MAG: cupin domain-containing protein [Nakamurella sp.]